jgi:hypothetical protein
VISRAYARKTAGIAVPLFKSSVDQAQKLEIATGSIGGNGYVLFHNPGV